MADASNGSEYFDIDVETGRKSSARPLNAETVEQDEEDLRLAAIGRLPSQRQGSHLATLRRSQTSGYADGNVVQTIDDNYKLLSAIKKRLNSCYTAGSAQSAPVAENQSSPRRHYG
ncbi:unnamed protein product [Brassica napus]|uniref:(rape) hypothetical protein n=1 Tax=Brassica napus TaxID=3708 RepID=A0A816K8Q4_BRANA|nr:unnamed protein product [Brassica napus]